MVHVAQVVLLSLKEDDSEPVQGQGATNIVVEHASTQIEPLVVLTSLRKLALLFREFSHLEVNMRLLHEVALLDACFRFHDQILG